MKLTHQLSHHFFEFIAISPHTTHYYLWYHLNFLVSKYYDRIKY